MLNLPQNLLYGTTMLLMLCLSPIISFPVQRIHMRLSDDFHHVSHLNINFVGGPTGEMLFGGKSANGEAY